MNELKTKLEKYKSSLISSEETGIKYDLSITLIDKLSQIIDELSDSNNDLHKLVSTLRYTLETLIVTKLLNTENDYFIKVTFSIYEQQINKLSSIIKRLKIELSILKEYSKKCSEKKEDNKQLHVGNSEKLALENENIFQNYKKLVQENINISFNHLEEYGFDVLITKIEYDLIRYEEKLVKFEDLREQKYKQLAKQIWFRNHTDSRVQWTKITKLLKDGRSWKEKAKAVGLDNEYELNYDFTSSLLHFSSYSLWTSNRAKEEELNYAYFLINQYVKHITINISKFSKVFVIDTFEEIKIQ